ncbi:hypothetical protein CGLO_14163 [Colletotrichum gloeosporioides Cg-14]|uniref:Uncharacterized protein n=1 Tax=Colletotrichum gloeosporioides (strain Cg-14) TaxID=1237896 RepID=T0JUV6_COLGC|nr:hypothetical protein CGLO_14163 [Colletotrichum gloeosporioides Cg-14]
MSTSRIRDSAATVLDCTKFRTLI